MQSRVTSTATAQLPTFRSVHLVKASWIDQAGRERDWEYAKRATCVDEVSVLAVLKQPQCNRLLLVSQFRPAVGCSVLELPGGFIDVGESMEEAAMRELLQQTGYRGIVQQVSPRLAEAPYISSGTPRLDG